jgi:TolA-binding protein
MSKIKAVVLLLIFTPMWLAAQETEWERNIQSTFEQARTLFDKQLYKPARTKFEEVINSGVSSHTRWAEESHYYRAMCALFMMNRDAEALLDEFSISYPTSALERKAALNAADYYFNKKDYKKAAEWLEKVDTRSIKGEELSEYYFRLGYAQLMNKNRDDAKINFLKIKDQTGDNAKSAKYYYAHIAYEDSNYTTAIENFEQLLDDPNFGPVVPYYLAQIYYRKAEFDKLIQYGEPLLARATEKRKPEIAKLLGEAYLRKNQYQKATEYLELYRKSGGKMLAQDNYSLGFAYYKTERYAEAIQAFNKINIAGTPADLAQNAYYHLADSYLKTDNKPQAMTAFKAAADVGDNEKITEDAFFNYAKLNYELANPFGGAISAFQDFLKKYPKSVKKEEANRYLANLYLTTKDYENALIALNNTGLNNKEMREAYQKVSYFRGVQLYNATELEKARTYFDQSLQYPINQTFVAQALFWKAESYFKQENYKATLQSIAAFEGTPGVHNLSEAVEARYTKAYAHFMLEEYASAITNFRLFVDNRKAENRKKQDSELRLGDSYFMTNNYPAAITFYNKYLGYNLPDADYALFQKSLCQGLDGKRNDKIATLDKLIKTYPKSKFVVDAKYEMGATHLALEYYAQALSTFQQFVKEYPQSRYTKRAWLNIGLIYRNTDRYDQSLEVFKKVVAEYPATVEANEAIAMARLIYARLNRVEEYVTWVENISFVDVKRASLDSTMYSSAFDFYAQSDCNEAIKGFEGYLKKFPDGYFIVESSYYLGECAYKLKQDNKAEYALERVISEPRNTFTERSISLLAAINFAKADYTKALGYYEQLLSFSEEMDQLRKARVGAMRSAVYLKEPNKALQYAEVILNDERASPEHRSEAMVVRARSYYQLGNTNMAHQAFEEVKSKAKGEPQAEASYYIALIQNERGEYAKSNETIFWMIDKLPSYQKWRYMALLVLAENYYGLDDIFQANYTLDFIIEENYNEEVVKQARDLKDAIARGQLDKDKKKSSVNDGTIDESSLDEY